MKSKVLSVKDLSISFSKDETWNQVLKNISFTVNSGETLGIVGESGSGKSVSCLALLGLLPKKLSRVDNGVATLSLGSHEHNLLDGSTSSLELRGSHVGMIFQEPMTSLNPLYTCGNQLVEVVQKHLKLTHAEALALAEEWFEKVELPNPKRVLSSYPHELSGGQRQRVMIAMTMSCKPKLLIADEPTTALDVTVQKSVLDLISKLQAENNTAVIFISHDLGVVKNIADNVLVMRQGEMIEFNNSKKLFESPQHNYTRGLIACKPENTLKENRLLTVNEVLKGNLSPSLRNSTFLNKGDVLYKVKNLNKSYVKRTGFIKKTSTIVEAVKDVSFEILRGETLGLVGESGCGKSTLSKILTGLLDADSGVLEYEGVDISSYDQKDWKNLRGKIQFIFQDPFSALNPRISVEKLILEVLIKHQPSLNNHEREELILKLIMDVGLTKESLFKYPHQFSGGQRQRIVIARALAAKPEFIIADESVSALDVSVQAQVLNLLNDLKSEYNLTFLFISHDLSVVHYMSDHVLVMNEGVIIERGSSEEIYNNPQKTYTKRLLESMYS